MARSEFWKEVQTLLDAPTSLAALGGTPNGTSVQLGPAPTGVAATDLANLQAALNALNASGGGRLILQPGTYAHSAAIARKKNCELVGQGKNTTFLQSTHVGNGIEGAEALNSSTAVYTGVTNLCVKNTNASNTGGGIVDVGGTYVEITNVAVEGFKYGTIFDQSVLFTQSRCELRSQLAGGAGTWIVNGADHTALASQFFTNRGSIVECQFNEGATTYGIVDDGGLAHVIERNNFNGCLRHIRVSGTSALRIAGNELEGAAQECVKFTSTTLAGTACGSSFGAAFTSNYSVAASGKNVILADGGSIHVSSNLVASDVAAFAGTASAIFTGEGGWQSSSGALFDGFTTHAVVTHRPGADTTEYSKSNTSDADLDATNLILPPFFAPPSGKVLVKFTASIERTAGGNAFWTLREGSSTVQSQLMTGDVGTGAYYRMTAVFLVTGLTPGSQHTYKWGQYASGGTTNYPGGPTYGDFIMEIEAL